MANSNEYMANYMADRYERRRLEYIAQLGGCCVKCGSKDRLEFDHIDPSTKSFGVSDRMAGMAKDRLDAEVAKCQLLCIGCHFEKTLVDKGIERWKHGTLSGYRYCRCPECKKAKSDHSRQARLLRVSNARVAQR